MQDLISIRIEILSNLFIGGMPVPFEIGGIDQRTAVDQNGYPCIPGSSLKGALRAIVSEDKSEMTQDISQLFKEYLEKDKEDTALLIQKRIKDIEGNGSSSQKRVNFQEKMEQMEERYKKVMEEVSPTYLFGIEGYNNTPKLLFEDLFLCDEFQKKEKCFSIDMKNSISTSETDIKANPRIYQTARRGLEFEGKIRLHRIEDLLGKGAGKLCKKYVIFNLEKFNEGIYRLGNSKSRGYGKVEVCVQDERGESIT